MQVLGFFIEFFRVLLWGLENYRLFTEQLPERRFLKGFLIPFYPMDLELFQKRKAEEEAKEAARAAGTDIEAEVFGLKLWYFIIL